MGELEVRIGQALQKVGQQAWLQACRVMAADLRWQSGSNCLLKFRLMGLDKADW